LERVPTGISGLDDLIGGGLQRGSCILLLGGPGTGKTTLGLQFLYAGATVYREPGLFITLNETPDELSAHVLVFGWDLKKLQNEKLLSFIDARPFKVSDKGLIVPNEEMFAGREEIPFSKLSYITYTMTRNLGIKRVVIDSVSVLLSQFKEEFVARQGLIGVIQALNHFGCTSLLILEKAVGEAVTSEQYITQGIIELQLRRLERTWIRTVHVPKMRGTKHDLDIHPIIIDEKGLTVFAKEKVLI